MDNRENANNFQIGGTDMATKSELGKNVQKKHSEEMVPISASICPTCGQKLSVDEQTPGHLQVVCEGCKIMIVL